MKDESAKIAAIVRIEGSMVWAGMEMSEAAAALDEECAKLRERLAELERERDEARRALVDEQHAHNSTRITLEQRDFGFLEARRMKDEAWQRVYEAQRERDAALAQLAACPVGPPQDAPDASARMWLMVGGWPDPTWYRIVSGKWIRRNFRQLNERVPRNAKWFKLKVQP